MTVTTRAVYYDSVFDPFVQIYSTSKYTLFLDV